MIHLTIRTYRRDMDGEDIADFGDVIDERDITLGEALELVLGRFWNLGSLGNIHSGLERLRENELALSYEYYWGLRSPEHLDRIPESCYAFWYSFTMPVRKLDKGMPGPEEDQMDFQNLYDVLVIYASYFGGRGSRMWLAPEVQVHLERQLEPPIPA